VNLLGSAKNLPLTAVSKSEPAKFRELQLGEQFQVGALTFQKLTQNTATQIHLASRAAPALQTAHLFRPERDVKRIENEHLEG
jgi:hypothetical protein